MQFSILKTEGSKDYQLLDSGEGEKLERFADVIVRRPDPRALWKKLFPQTAWDKAVAQFSRATEKGSWKIEPGVPERWSIEFSDLKLWVRPTSFKHVGLFPEQKANWNWIRQTIKKSGKTPKVLNLFGYTGGATLAAAQAGAEVVHVDGSKTAITWAKENAELSGLADKPIRWIVDDALAFVRREVKRGNKYDGIIMDPPAFGRGSKGEVWKIEDDLLPLLDACKKLLSDTPLFFLINGYASGYSALAYKNTLDSLLQDWKGTTEIGELALEESTHKRLLPAGIFARWTSGV